MGNASYKVVSPVSVAGIGKNVQTDAFEGWQTLRSLTAVESAAIGTLVTPGMLESMGVRELRAKVLALRVWSNASGGTVPLNILSAQPNGPQLVGGTTTQLATKSAASLLFSGTVTTSGYSVSGVNPITGAATAGTTWYAASAFSANTQHPAQLITQTPAVACTGYEMRWLIDAVCATRHYAYLASAFGGATAAIVGICVVE